MTNIMRWLARGLFAGGLALSVSGCGGGGSSGSSSSSGGISKVQEDQFGTAFGKDFRADPNSEPANVSNGDIVAVSLTTEPTEIK